MPTVTTYGDARQLTKSALLGLGATQQDANGRFYVDGSMVNVELSQTIAEVLYAKAIFRDGQSVTAKYTTDLRQNGAVRVLLDTPLPFGSRTTSFGGRAGTEGNSGVINKNAPLLPSNDEIMIYLNQVNDQSMLFPDISKEYIPMDVMVKKINQYTSRVQMDRDSSTLAEIIAYAFFRQLNGDETLVTPADLTAQYALGDLVNDLHTKLDGGDPEMGAYTYPTEGRTIIGRPSFINKFMNIKSGIIVNGGDLAQQMLRDYSFDTEMSARSFVGTGYKGNAAGFHLVSAPDIIWTLAEKYLGLSAGSLSDVYAICVSSEATAVANGVDLGVKIIDANEVRGSKAQPLNMWGHEAFRKSYVIADTAFNNASITGLGFTATARKYPVAPAAVNLGANITVPVYGTDGEVIGYKTVAHVPAFAPSAE